MLILPLDSRLKKYLKKHNLEKQFNKQIKLLTNNIKARSLNFKKLKPTYLNHYSFRTTKQYRALCLKQDNYLEIFDINNHYQ